MRNRLALFMGGVLLLAAGAYALDQTRETSLIFSPTQVLGATWLTYKQEYLETTGRTLDKQRGNVTTSEGQSYTMLRAVWQGDKETFDRSWQWTKDNLLREEEFDPGVSATTTLAH